MTAINVVQGLAPTEVKYGSINIDEETSTYEISGVAAANQTIIESNSQLSLAGSYYNINTLLTSYTFVGKGYPIEFHFTNEVLSTVGAGSSPWGQFTMGSSTYLNFGYIMTLKNDTTNADHLVSDTFYHICFANGPDAGKNYIYQPRPVLNFTYTANYLNTYTVRVEWIKIRAAGTSGTLTGIASINRIFKLTESRF